MIASAGIDLRRPEKDDRHQANPAWRGVTREAARLSRSPAPSPALRALAEPRPYSKVNCMKKLVLGTLIAAFLPVASYAATLKFPSDEPVASITIPDSWGPKETETGIDATSDDSAIYISIDVADPKTTDKVIDDAIAYLEKNGVKIDGSTQKKSDEMVNGMSMTNFDWDGTDSDGGVNVGLSLLAPSADKLLVITYWGSKGTQEKHGAELQAIISSLKAAN